MLFLVVAVAVTIFGLADCLYLWTAKATAIEESSTAAPAEAATAKATHDLIY